MSSVHSAVPLFDDHRNPPHLMPEAEVNYGMKIRSRSCTESPSVICQE